MSTSQWKEAAKVPAKIMVGRVVNAGERLRTIRVRVPRMQWNNRVNKYFRVFDHYLVRDPRRSSRVGDVVTIRGNWRVAKHVNHLLLSIDTPYGEPLETRPPVPTIAELVEEKRKWRIAKDQRQAERGRQSAVERVQQRLEEQESEVVAKQESEQIAAMTEKERGEYAGKQLAERHIKWAMDPSLTNVALKVGYPVNKHFRLLVRDVMNKVYDAGAWPRWDSEIFRLQQLGSLLSLLKRSRQSVKDSETVKAGVSAYEKILLAKVDEISEGMKSRFTEKSFNAAKAVLERVVEADNSRLPGLGLGTEEIQKLQLVDTESLSDLITRTERVQLE